MTLPYHAARALARRLVRDGDLPREAASFAAADYSLSATETAMLVDELECEHTPPRSSFDPGDNLAIAQARLLGVWGIL